MGLPAPASSKGQSASTYRQAAMLSESARERLRDIASTPSSLGGL